MILTAKYQTHELYDLTIEQLPQCVSIQVRFQNTMSGQTFVWLGDSNSNGVAKLGKLKFSQATAVRVIVLDKQFADDQSLSFVHRDITQDLRMESPTTKIVMSYSPFFTPVQSIELSKKLVEPEDEPELQPAPMVQED